MGLQLRQQLQGIMEKRGKREVPGNSKNWGSNFSVLVDIHFLDLVGFRFSDLVDIHFLDLVDCHFSDLVDFYFSDLVLPLCG